MNVKKIMERCINSRYFSWRNSPFSGTFWPGKAGSRLFLVTGDNASGKSFLGRLLQANIDKDKAFVARLGMEKRTGGGVVNAFVYGGEYNESTGAITAHSVLGLIASAAKWDKDHIIFFDEPDIGLSESYQGAIGAVIAKFVAKLPQRTKAVCVVTHSRRIASHLAMLRPHFVRLGDKMDMEQWLLKEPDDAKNLEDLPKLGRSRQLKTFKIIESAKKKSK